MTDNEATNVVRHERVSEEAMKLTIDVLQKREGIL